MDEISRRGFTDIETPKLLFILEKVGASLEKKIQVESFEDKSVLENPFEQKSFLFDPKY